MSFWTRLRDAFRPPPPADFTPSPAERKPGLLSRLFGRGKPKRRPRREPRREPTPIAKPTDALGRDIPDYEIDRWTSGGGEWHDGPPSESTLRRHIGDPDFMMTVHFPDLDGDPDLSSRYNMVGGFDNWDEFEVAVVDMYMDYTG